MNITEDELGTSCINFIESI